MTASKQRKGYPAAKAPSKSGASMSGPKKHKAGSTKPVKVKKPKK